MIMTGMQQQGFVRFYRDWRVWVTAGLLICLASWAVYYRASDPSHASRPFRVGFETSPPYQYFGADGKPTGPAVDIITEAARRANIPIEWVYAPEGSEKSLRSGRVDL